MVTVNIYVPIKAVSPYLLLRSSAHVIISAFVSPKGQGCQSLLLSMFEMLCTQRCLSSLVSNSDPILDEKFHWLIERLGMYVGPYVAGRLTAVVGEWRGCLSSLVNAVDVYL